MANLASDVWQDATTALLLAVHGERAPTDREWDRFCSFIPALLSHPNGGCVVITDGGAPTGLQRERLRKLLGDASRWTAVVTDRALVRGVVTAVRWFNPKVCAFAPWELREAFKFVAVVEDEIASICETLCTLDQQLDARSKVLLAALERLERGSSVRRA